MGEHGAGAYCGLVLVDKPAGITSHDVVAQARRRFDTRRVGHAGTLDPFATGLLVLLLGRATRLQRYMLHLPKTYRVVARLGWRSSTGDRDGELENTGRLPEDPQLPEGELALPVPAYSAIKVDGKRLYKRAREGEEFEPPVRTMTVYRARRMDYAGEYATFELECSGGTYVRSVVETLHDAYCDQLVRLRVGTMSLDDADEQKVLDPLAGLAHLHLLRVDHQQALTLVHGRRLEWDGAEAGPVAVTLGDTLVGVAVDDGGCLRGETMLAGSPQELDRLLEAAQ
jgi:tRNA pseudouridine55 synthase